MLKKNLGVDFVAELGAPTRLEIIRSSESLVIYNYIILWVAIFQEKCIHYYLYQLVNSFDWG